MITANQFSNLIRIAEVGPNFTLQDLAAKIANIFLLLAGFIAFVYLIYAGILYITAGGNADQAQRAQRAFINVIIGIVIITLSYVVIRVAGNFAARIVS
jgi:bacteriorhodopsin